MTEFQYQVVLVFVALCYLVAFGMWRKTRNTLLERESHIAAQKTYIADLMRKIEKIDGELQVPNLDDTPVLQLDYYKNTFRLLARYCEYIAQAKIDRFEGRVEEALAGERAAQHLYDHLPSEHRW